MDPTSTISSKGQITVPVEVRRRLGIKAGDRVEFVFEGGRTVLRPARNEKSPFAQFVGVLPAFKNRREINAWIRNLRAEDGRGERKP